MALASVTCRQHGYGEMAGGSDSARIELFLSNGKRLTSPLLGAPRYRTDSGKYVESREAIWRWAWHSQMTPELDLSDSTSTVDSIIIETSWRIRNTGKLYTLLTKDDQVAICISHQTLD